MQQTPLADDDRAARLRAILTAQFAPTDLSVVDDSARHAGHAGAAAGGQTHYNVLIVAERFRGLGRVDRHRLVNQAVAEEFTRGLHALALVLRTPDEPGPG